MHASKEKCFQNLEINNLSQSEIICKRRPFSQYQLLKKIGVRDSAFKLVVVGMICMSAPSLSVIVRMQSKLSSRGRGQMKSMVMMSH